LFVTIRCSHEPLYQRKYMKAAHIISTLFYRLSVLVTIFAIVLGIIFIPIADDPMPVLKVLAIVAIVGGVLSAVFKVIVKRTKPVNFENK